MVLLFSGNGILLVMNNTFKNIIIVVFLVFIFFITIGKDLLVKFMVPPMASKILGATVHLDNFSMNIVTSRVSIDGLRIDNPEGFPLSTMVDVDHVHIAYDIPALLGGKLHLPLTDISLRQITLVRNERGKLNVKELNILEMKQKNNTMPMALDEVRLNVGKIILLDYTKGNPPKETQVQTGLNHKVYRHITNPAQLAGAIFLDMTGVSRVAGLAVDIIKDVGGDTKGIGKRVVNTGVNIIKDVTSILK